MSYYAYAKLGQSCETSLAVLSSNTKFFPLDNAVYNEFPTRMQHYPGILHQIRGKEIDKERTKNEKDAVKEGFEKPSGYAETRYVKSTCCGN